MGASGEGAWEQVGRECASTGASGEGVECWREYVYRDVCESEHVTSGLSNKVIVYYSQQSTVLSLSLSLSSQMDTEIWEVEVEIAGLERSSLR